MFIEISGDEFSINIKYFENISIILLLITYHSSLFPHHSSLFSYHSFLIPHISPLIVCHFSLFTHHHSSYIPYTTPLITHLLSLVTKFVGNFVFKKISAKFVKCYFAAPLPSTLKSPCLDNTDRQTVL